MRYAYWFDAIMGLILVLAPSVGKLAQDWRAVDVAVGLSLLAWAMVTYLNPGRQNVPGTRPNHA